ncbi:patatin-like phospholipase family protein [Synergistaceae bacterium OttesenSCG-928-D05]|nr:patatin-like phospholipase family protein [Synergistaceae bacterium OttesenSCG-928-D05]
MAEQHRTGLVLSGGGAKGAYQVGVIKALAEMDVKIDFLSGASIGALNGAVLACAGSLAEGAAQLEDIWRKVVQNPPIEGETPALVKMLENAGVQITPEFRGKAIIANSALQNLVSTLRSPETEALVDNTPIKKLICQYVSPQKLAKGLPLYVSVFPNTKTLDSVIGSTLAFLGVKENPASEFLLIQSLSPEDQNKALLASSAIPFLLRAQEIDGASYIDGGMGGFAYSQGNTPIEPLLETGCERIIVTYLTEHSRWDKKKYPNVKIFAVSREKSINRTPILPELFDVLAFTADKVDSWIEQGYHDTKKYLTPKLKQLHA